MTQSGHRQFRICAATPDSGASEVRRRVSRKGTTFARSSAGVICSQSWPARNANVCIWFPCVLRKYSRRKPPNSAGVHFQGPLIAAGGLSILEVSMSEKLISRRGAFSLLGLAAALGFAVPTTVLMTSDADAQAQPAAPAPATPAPTTPAPSAGTPGMNRRQARRAGRHERREARRNTRHERREARRGNNLYMKSDTTKQK
jgi:hypothetical protein